MVDHIDGCINLEFGQPLETHDKTLNLFRCVRPHLRRLVMQGFKGRQPCRGTITKMPVFSLLELLADGDIAAPRLESLSVHLSPMVATAVASGVHDDKPILTNAISTPPALRSLELRAWPADGGESQPIFVSELWDPSVQVRLEHLSINCDAVPCSLPSTASSVRHLYITMCEVQESSILLCLDHLARTPLPKLERLEIQQLISKEFLSPWSDAETELIVKAFKNMPSLTSASLLIWTDE